MKSYEHLLQTIRSHEKRIAELESMLSKGSPVIIKPVRKSLTGVIISLRDSGYFSSQRTFEETHTKIQEEYRCEKNRVAVALNRLAERKLLRKASKIINGKKYQAFVW